MSPRRLGLFIVISLCLARVAGCAPYLPPPAASGPSPTPAEQGARLPTLPAWATLTADATVVSRTEVTGDHNPQSLQWVVAMGEREAARRVAANELKFDLTWQVTDPGQYTVWLIDVKDGAERIISNKVMVTLAPPDASVPLTAAPPTAAPPSDVVACRDTANLLFAGLPVSRPLTGRLWTKAGQFMRTLQGMTDAKGSMTLVVPMRDTDAAGGYTVSLFDAVGNPVANREFTYVGCPNSPSQPPPSSSNPPSNPPIKIITPVPPSNPPSNPPIKIITPVPPSNPPLPPAVRISGPSGTVPCTGNVQIVVSGLPAYANVVLAVWPAAGGGGPRSSGRFSKSAGANGVIATYVTMEQSDPAGQYGLAVYDTYGSLLAQTSFWYAGCGGGSDGPAGAGRVWAVYGAINCGQTQEFRGTGLQPYTNYTVRLKVEGSRQEYELNARTDGQGNFSLAYRMAGDLPSGTYDVYAERAPSEYLTGNTFVYRGCGTGTGNPTLRVVYPMVECNQQQRIIATGLVPYQTYIFHIGEMLRVYGNGQSPAPLAGVPYTADANGVIDFWYPMVNLTPGQYHVSIEGLTVTATFDYRGCGNRPRGEGVWRLVAANAQCGELFTATAQGFGAGERVRFTIIGAEDTAQEATADADGNASAQLRMPASWQSSSATVQAASVNGEGQATYEISVQCGGGWGPGTSGSGGGDWIITPEPPDDDSGDYITPEPPTDDGGSSVPPPVFGGDW